VTRNRPRRLPKTATLLITETVETVVNSHETRHDTERLRDPPDRGIDIAAPAIAAPATPAATPANTHTVLATHLNTVDTLQTAWLPPEAWCL
jgi:hypothetical protein